MQDPPGSLEIPIAQRLALAYSPGALRPFWRAYFSLDARLSVVRDRAKEPIIAQMRFAWWREQLASVSAGKGHDEPLLAEISGLGPAAAGFAHLADGWEAMLFASDDPVDTVSKLARSRCQALGDSLGANGQDDGVLQASTAWTMAEFSPTGSSELASDRLRLPPAYRPLLVLGRLGQRAMAFRRHELLASPTDLVLAMRIGLLGR